MHTCSYADVKRNMPFSAECDLLKYRGLCVFPSRTGGRGVHIHSMRPGWHAAILMQTGERLHGSVVPSRVSMDQDGFMTCSLHGEDISGLALPHLHLMRVVTYPLRRVESLLQRLAIDPSVAKVVSSMSGNWLKDRMTSNY